MVWGKRATGVGGGMQTEAGIDRAEYRQRRGWVLTCHQVPNEECLVLLVVLQHALEVLLLPLHRDLPGELMVLPVILGQCLHS